MPVYSLIDIEVGKSTEEKGGLHSMLKDFVWKIFEYTGSVDSYIFYKEMEERDSAEEQSVTTGAEAATSGS